MDNEEIFKIYKDTRKDNNNGALWEVSNLGSVRKNGDDYIPFETKKGYLAFGENCYVHRAVAEIFIENIDHKPTVDHINRDKHDNRVCNLRWATYKEQSDNRDWEKICMKMRGKKLSEEHRAKLRAAHLGNKNALGHRPSDESKAKMGAGTIGKVYVFNPTTEHLTCVNPSQLTEYLAKGYIRGRKIKK